jgi:KDO2-lipid IV(A) lauroyltransferase
LDHSRERRTSHKFYRPIVAWILRRAARIAQGMPRRLALAVGESLGATAACLAHRSIRRASKNLRAAFGPGVSRKWIADTLRECFVAFGRSLMETLRLPALTDAELRRIVVCEGAERIDRALSRGNGVLILSAHMGAWEVLAAWLGLKTGRPFHAIGRRMSVEAYDEVLVGTRRRAGVETVYQDEGPRKTLGILRENRPLGILVDQDVPQLDSVFVEFFGRAAHTPTAPVALARTTGAALLPVLITWSGHRHRVRVYPEIELVRTGDRRADTVENTQRWSRVVERAIREHPSQWAWFHQRWRTQPPA